MADSADVLRERVGQRFVVADPGYDGDLPSATTTSRTESVLAILALEGYE